jgi:hypothetical protein
MKIWSIGGIGQALPTIGAPNASCVCENVFKLIGMNYSLDVNLSEKVDNYALGCIIFEMATG